MMRKMMLALASACLLIIPAIAQDNPPRDNGMARHEMQMGRKMLEGMSVEGRKIMAVEMIDGREKMKAGHEAREAIRDKVRTAMTAEPFNANVLRSAFEEERKIANDQQKSHHEHMVGVMGKLSVADRKIFAQSMGNMEQRIMKMHGSSKDKEMQEKL
jgi:Heavy-metal resistance